MITWGFASAADILAYYGEIPRETMRAIAIRMNDVPVAMIGMAFESDRMRAFSDYQPQLAPHLKSLPVLRAIKAAQRMFCESCKPVLAVRVTDSGILERLGFEHVDDDVYRLAR